MEEDQTSVKEDAESPKSEPASTEESISPQNPTIPIGNATAVSNEVDTNEKEEFRKNLDIHRKLIDFNFNIMTLVVIILFLFIAGIIINAWFSDRDSYQKYIDAINQLQKDQYQSLEKRVEYLENSKLIPNASNSAAASH